MLVWRFDLERPFGQRTNHPSTSDHQIITNNPPTLSTYSKDNRYGHIPIIEDAMPSLFVNVVLLNYIACTAAAALIKFIDLEDRTRRW